MIYLLTILFCFQLLIAIILWFGKQKTKHIQYLENYQSTSVIIPFKNEKDRILPLLQSINNAAIKNKHNNLFEHLDFIFVDDHSTDDTYKMILDNLDVKFRLFKLRTTSGKKYAIKYGVEQSKFERILTLDADVTFNSDYFNFICKTPCVNLTILPVKMQGKRILQSLFSIEFSWLQHLTFGSAGLKQPTLCNGANLLFTKSAFLKSLSVRHDANQKSGDDVFLLHAIQSLNLPVLACYSPTVSVNTPAPETFYKLTQQRKRWIKKMPNASSILGGIFIILLNLAFVYSLFFVWTNPLFILPIGVKFLSELISIDTNKQKLLLILHQFYYPLYLVVLILSLPFKEKWR